MLQALLLEGDRRTPITWPAEKSRWAVGNGILWLDLHAPTPTPTDMETLATEFGLHQTVVRACLHPEHRARLKEFKDHMLVVLNAVGRGTSENGAAAAGEISRWRTLELNVIIGSRFLITVHPEAVPAVSHLFQRMSRPGEGKSTLTYLFYSLLENVTSGYYLVLDRVDKYVDEAETLIFRGDVTQKAIDRLFQLKRHILYLRRVLGPQRDVLGALMRREFPILPAEARPYLVDTYEHTLRLFDLLDTYRDLISSSVDAYLSTVSNRMNEIMKTLTIVSTIMLPLTLISGIFGMNFAIMPLLDSPSGFGIVMLGMLAIGGAMFYFFKRRGWM